LRRGRKPDLNAALEEFLGRQKFGGQEKVKEEENKKGDEDDGKGEFPFSLHVQPLTYLTFLQCSRYKYLILRTID
jgi:hypothetical protein